MCVCVVYVCFITDVVSVAVAAVVVVAPVLVPLIYTALKVEENDALEKTIQTYNQLKTKTTNL